MTMYPDSGTQRRPFELEYGTTERSTFNFFNAVYAWMAVGLAVTAATAWFTANTPALVKATYSGPFVMLAAVIGLSVIAYATQSIALRISAAAGTGMFLLYSGLMGMLISYVLIIYKLKTIGAAFLLTGGVFGVMSLYGFVTKRDLTTIGSYMVMAFFGLFIASLVNIFMKSDGLGWVITYGVLLLTIGITAYETQKLKAWASEFEGNPQMLNRLAVVGSLMLYVTFINMFLSILRIIGGRKYRERDDCLRT
jgi:FtsH-binding integral membrane protein